MALQLDYTKTVPSFSGTLTLSDAYWKVEQVIATKTEATCIVTINKTESGAKIQVDNKRYSFVPDLDGSNFIAQAYAHLKTLPEFSGATDV